MERFELLRKIYNSLDDGKGILDFSLAEGNYIIGGKTVSEFITEADKLLYGRSF